MNALKILGVLVISFLLLAAGYFGHPYVSTFLENDEKDEAPKETSNRIEAQGRLEPSSGTLTISALPGEEIVELKVHVGEVVEKNDELAILGSKSLREEELELARTRLQQAEQQLTVQKQLAEQRQRAANLALKETNSDQKEIFAAQQQAIDVGEARRELAEQQLARLKELQADEATAAAISDTEIEQQQLLIDQIKAELRQNNAKLEAARGTHGTAVEAAELESEIADTTFATLDDSSPIAVLKQSVKLAEVAEKASTILAPCDGKILEIYVREGERMSKTPILQMGDLSRIVCVAEVHEAKIESLECKENDDGRLVPTKDHTVTITNPAFKDEILTGQVVEVSRLIGAPSLRDPNPLAKADLRAAKVRIELDKECTEEAGRFIHLQVDVSINFDE